MTSESIYDLIAKTSIVLKKTPNHHPHIKTLQKDMSFTNCQAEIRVIIKGFLEKMNAKS